MKPLDNNDDSMWVTLPPAPKMSARDFVISRAADLYQLRRLIRTGGLLHARVPKSFHTAMQSFPLPDKPFQSKPQKADVFFHLATCRLDGAPLPIPLEQFKP